MNTLVGSAADTADRAAGMVLQKVSQKVLQRISKRVLR